jgi:23S rRNA C2498 (ribose-2'-O)-methylase RlmM
MPMIKALSIRQPWAWLIVSGYKTLENRSRNIGFPRKPFLIHASSRMTLADYDACVLFLRSNKALRHLVEILPDPDGYALGGIVGVATMDFMHRFSGVFVQDSPHKHWYTGDVGYVLKDAKPLPFKPCKGRLGFFEVDYEGLTA